MPRHNKKGRRNAKQRNPCRTLWRDMTRRQVGHAAGYICLYCGRKTKKDGPDGDPLAFTLDHIIPISRGGTWDFDNLACACLACNNAKGDKTAAEFARQRNAG